MDWLKETLRSLKVKYEWKQSAMVPNIYRETEQNKTVWRFMSENTIPTYLLTQILTPTHIVTEGRQKNCKSYFKLSSYS